MKLKICKKVIMNGIQHFDDHCLRLNIDFSNSFFDQTPASSRQVFLAASEMDLMHFD